MDGVKPEIDKPSIDSKSNNAQLNVKNGRCPVLHPNCSRYFSPDGLASMNSSVSFLSLKQFHNYCNIMNPIPPIVPVPRLCYRKLQYLAFLFILSKLH
ncbi:hypothetical protein P8452_72546 [Trifolium repens]|nr:hypothetical protein P8452_72546 [Trifolium repens]